MIFDELYHTYISICQFAVVGRFYFSLYIASNKTKFAVQTVVKCANYTDNMKGYFENNVNFEVIKQFMFQSSSSSPYKTY